MDSIFTLVEVTATYSNAVLVAILPHMTDVAKTLELPIHTPIEQSEVRHFMCDPRADQMGGYVVLTNGYEFWFHHGIVEGFASAKNVFRLQDPELIPKFYGPLRMNEKEAVALARQSLKKLGYTNDVFDAIHPEVQLESPIESFATNQGVPQYEVTWYDPHSHALHPIGQIANVDVNAEYKHVNGYNLFSRIFWRTNPDVGIKPKIINKGLTDPIFVGGHRLTPVSIAYSNACMDVMMPIFTDYAKKLNLPIQLPITRNQCTNTECWTDNNEPNVQIILNNGYRFNYDHGYIHAFYAVDNYFFGDLFNNLHIPESELYQSQPPSKEELVKIARQAIHNLGYSEKALKMEGPPDLISIPQDDTKGHYFTRYKIGWDYMMLDSEIDGHRVTVEVDAKSKTVKSIYLNNTNLWREPPKIDVPLEPAK